jgi:hypothetical protein
MRQKSGCLGIDLFERHHHIGRQGVIVLPQPVPIVGDLLRFPASGEGRE